MEILRLAAFSDGTTGGNPAGIVIEPAFPKAMIMRQVAADVGYSETAFAVPIDGGWKVRYFSPESEVPFCGHATIALGAVLAQQQGAGTFNLRLKASDISVSGKPDGELYSATLTSPPTSTSACPEELLPQALQLFGLSSAQLNMTLPPVIADAGSAQLMLTLNDRDDLRTMNYDLSAGKALMDAADLVGISLLYFDERGVVHTRSAFASGGVLEDPATGAAAAALGGYLREVDWPGYLNGIDIVQGEDMGMRSILRVDLTDEAGSPVQVSGTARSL